MAKSLADIANESFENSSPFHASFKKVIPEVEEFVGFINKVFEQPKFQSTIYRKLSLECMPFSPGDRSGHFRFYYFDGSSTDGQANPPAVATLDYNAESRMFVPSEDTKTHQPRIKGFNDTKGSSDTPVIDQLKIAALTLVMSNMSPQQAQDLRDALIDYEIKNPQVVAKKRAADLNELAKAMP